MNERDDRPWYRYLWPWLLMIPPAGAVIGGMLTAWLAGGPPALVVDDYSEIALATERRLARDRRAEELGLHATLVLNRPGSEQDIDVQVQLGANSEDFQAPERLLLTFVHPTRADLDRGTELVRQDDQYVGRLWRPPGRLYLHLGDNGGQWRLVGELRPGEARLDVQAGSAP